MFKEASWITSHQSYESLHSSTDFDDSDILTPSTRRSSCISNSSLNTTNLNKKRPEKWTISESNLRQSESNTYLAKEENIKDPDEENKRFSYCYLCSIGAHEHKKTEPVPVHKRRYLKPYLNPIQLMKKFEKDQYNLIIKTKYKFIVKTGAGTNTGTDSNVYFKLYGSDGTWDKTELKNKAGSGVNFPPNSLVEVNLDGPVIGELKKLQIWHNGKSIRDGWYLDFIEITSYKQMQTWRFVCDQWLSIHRPPDYSNSIILTLNSNKFDNIKTRNETEYFILIKTSGKPLIGNDINCQFQFAGTKYQSNVFNLLTPYTRLFDKNQLDCFLVTSSHDLGPPQKLKLAHNSRKMPHLWSIDFIKVIYSREPNKFYLFKVDQWLDKNDRMNAIISFNSEIPIVNPDSTKTDKMIYYISVITGSAKKAGTDAKVFIEMKGTKGTTNVHRLHNSRAKEFRSGQMDHFQIIDNDIGQIQKIRVWHDNSGSSPSWLLDAVLIRSISTTISGVDSKHDSDVNIQLEKLRKKFKIKALKLEISDLAHSKKPRSKSAEIIRRNKLAKNKLKKPRSASADGKSKKANPLGSKTNSQTDLEKSSDSINYKEILKRNLEKSSSKDLSSQSPSPSILKTSASPRKDATSRKQVKFDSSLNSAADDSQKLDKKPEKTDKTDKSKKQPDTTKIEMQIQWVMTINYNDSTSNSVKNIFTIEEHDNSIQKINDKLLNFYDSKTNKLLQPQTTDPAKPDEVNIGTSKPENIENLIHVFECKKWLAKDIDDKKTERILKLSNFLKVK